AVYGRYYTRKAAMGSACAARRAGPHAVFLFAGYGLFQNRRSQRTGMGWLARMRGKSVCSWLIRTFRSTFVTTEGTMSTGVRRSSYHWSPNDRAASNDGEFHRGRSSGVISSMDKPAGISVSI